jgi:hypothetical protein
VELPRYTGPWADDDPDATFKAQVAEYSRNDPLPTLQRLSENTGIPVESLVRYILGRWTAAGSEALMALGPRTLDELWEVVATADRDGGDAAKLAAFDKLRGMLSWLRAPLDPDNIPPQRPR